MLIKHLAETIYRRYLKVINQTSNLNLNNNDLTNIKEKSYCIIENFLSQDECGDYIKKIISAKNLIKNNNDKTRLGYWSDSIASDTRFFKFQNFDNTLNKKILNNELILKYHKSITGRKLAEKSLMANHVKFIDKNEGSGGGWHRDTRFRTYFKAFIYLNDVDEKNGPLEFIEGSHRLKEIYKFYKNNFLEKNEFRFTEEFIEKLIKETNAVKKKITGKKGTLILANTKAIHRGRPLIAGERYAFTIYFADTKFKKSFIDL